MAIMAGYIPQEQQWNLTGQQMMDGSFIDEVQKNQQNLREAARAEAIRQDPTLSYVQRRLASGLLGAKRDWQNAYDAGNAEGMAAAALKGESLRKQADAIGWNGNGYGADVSLLEAAQNLANNDTRAVNDVLYNLKDGNSVYTQKVADYLDKGYSIDSAKRLAGQRSAEATQGNIEQLRDAFRMYGMDERGAITPQGADLLASMALNGQSELANFYSNMMAKPVQNWNFENDLLKMAQAQSDRLQSMDRQQQYNRENMATSHAYNEETLNNNVQRALDQAMGMLGVNQMGQEMQIATRQKLANQYAAMGLITPEMAASYAMTGYLVPKGTSGANSKADKGLIDSLMKRAESLRNQAGEAELNGNKELAAQLMAQATEYDRRADELMGMSRGKQDNGPGINVNDYNEVRNYYQKLINENEARPWDKQLTRAQLEQVLVNDCGDTEITRNIIENANYDGDSKKAEQPQEASKANEPPKQSPRPSNASGSSYNNGQQIVVPKEAQQQVSAVLEGVVHGDGPQLSRAYQERYGRYLNK